MICELNFFFFGYFTKERSLFDLLYQQGSFYGLVLVLIRFQLNYCLWEKFTYSGLMQQISTTVSFNSMIFKFVQLKLT